MIKSTRTGLFFIEYVFFYIFVKHLTDLQAVICVFLYLRPVYCRYYKDVILGPRFYPFMRATVFYAVFTSCSQCGQLCGGFGDH